MTSIALRERPLRAHGAASDPQGCAGFAADTAVLTPAGWVRLDAFEGGEVMQWEAGGVLSFVPCLPPSVTMSNRSLRVATNKKGGVDLVVGPNHLLLSVPVGTALPSSHPAAGRPRSVARHVPRVGMFDGHGIDLSDSEIRLLIAICADATIDVRKKDGGTYVRFGLSKERKKARLRWLLTDLGIDASDERIAGGVQSICFKVPCYLSAFKEFPIAWFAQASSRQRELILRELPEWDGNTVPNRDQDEFSSKSTANAVWVQTLAHTTGRVSTLMSRSNKFGSWWKVSVLHGKRASSWQAIVTSEAGPALLYSLVVPSGMLPVRRGEQIVVVGAGS